MNLPDHKVMERIPVVLGVFHTSRLLKLRKHRDEGDFLGQKNQAVKTFEKGSSNFVATSHDLGTPKGL